VLQLLRKIKYIHDLRRWTPEDQERLEFYSQLIRPGDLVFDIGANIGNRSKIFLKLGARVIAFEPQTFCCEILKYAHNGRSDFTIVHGGMAAKPGTADLHVGQSHVLATFSDSWIDLTGQSGRFGDHKWNKQERVSLTTFDTAIRDYGTPVFSKIDVEGFERQVISGLSLPIRSGSIEFTAEVLDTTLWCMERLGSISSYMFQYSAGESMEFAWKEWCEPQAARDRLKHIAQDRTAWGDLYFMRAFGAYTATP
jgi:FkbM family methyltransferase